MLEKIFLGFALLITTICMIVLIVIFIIISAYAIKDKIEEIKLGGKHGKDSKTKIYKS